MHIVGTHGLRTVPSGQLGGSRRHDLGDVVAQFLFDDRQGGVDTSVAGIGAAAATGIARNIRGGRCIWHAAIVLQRPPIGR